MQTTPGLIFFNFNNTIQSSTSEQSQYIIINQLLQLQREQRQRETSQRSAISPSKVNIDTFINLQHQPDQQRVPATSRLLRFATAVIRCHRGGTHRRRSHRDHHCGGRGGVGPTPPAG